MNTIWACVHEAEGSVNCELIDREGLWLAASRWLGVHRKAKARAAGNHGNPIVEHPTTLRPERHVGIYANSSALYMLLSLSSNLERSP
jgi:hypothetical protein